MAGAVQFYFFSQDPGIRSKAIAPELVTEHHDMVAAGLVFFRQEASADGGIYTQDRKEVRRNIGRAYADRISGARQIGAAAGKRG